MKTQVIKSLAVALATTGAFVAQANQEYRGESSSRPEIESAMEDLNSRGVNLFSTEENCEIQILSHTTYSYRLIARENIKRIRYIGPVMEFTVTDQVCQGEDQCVEFLLTGEVDLETNIKTVKKVEIKQEIKDELAENQDSQDEIVEKKQSLSYSKPKPFDRVTPLILNLGSDQTYSASVVCTKGARSNKG